MDHFKIKLIFKFIPNDKIYIFNNNNIELKI